MAELTEVITKDGSFSLKSAFYKENFHSMQGALTETKVKFINPSDLERFKNKSLNVLDICFGIGYNSALLFNTLISQNSSVNWYALEIDKKPLEYTLTNEYFKELWDPKILEIYNSLHRDNMFEDQFFKCNILWGDAREEFFNIPASLEFDLIYLDGFSPQKCPQVWTNEFLSKVSQKLKNFGYLITYSSSAAVRKTLKNLGLEIFSIKPNLISQKSWSQGTVAIAGFDKKKYQGNLYFETLSKREEEHLFTKASIPYRDPDLNFKAEDIIKERLKEQSISNLISAKEWRERWE